MFSISHEKLTLSNGLEVVLHQDHTLPIVDVNVWYHVGSKDEEMGRTGFAHLFEHVMFEGSENHNSSFFEPLQKAGANLNGSTTPDRTNYWEDVPSNYLELALWLEADRMGFLLGALDQQRFDIQRDVVKNERRQSYENRPYGMAHWHLQEALYPMPHPYHWMTIGAPEDLRAAKLEGAHQFFRKYYHPGNASLTLAGDVDTDQAISLARKHFEDIEPGPASIPLNTDRSVVKSQGEIRLLIEDLVELPRLYLAWRTPALFLTGDAELDVLADILTNGKASRLYRKLVHDRRIVTDIAAAQDSRELSSFFQIVATAAPGHDLAEVEKAVTDEVDYIVDAGPSTDDLERSMVQVESQFVYRLGTVGGFGGKSDQLNAYNVFVGDPGYFERDLMRYQDATISRIQEVSSCLSRTERVVLSVVPKGCHQLAVADSRPVSVS